MVLKLITRFIFCVLLFNQTVFSEAKQPNILVFLVDDMGLMDTSLPFITNKKGEAEKHPLNDFYITPNMERLAKQGIRFSNFYAMSVCSPTRASIMNGQTSARHTTTQFIKPESNNAGTFGPKNWKWNGPNQQDILLPKLLKSNGYQTIFCGKAHFGPVGSFAEEPTHLGFDINIAGCAYGRPGSYYGEDGFGKNGNRAIPGLEKYHDQDIFLTEALTLELKETLTKAVKKDQPFFAYMSHYAIHSPFQSDPRFANNYKSDSKPLNSFATLVEGMDKSLGDLMDHLNTLGVAEDTLIFFLGDNGSDAPTKNTHGIFSSAPLRGKKGTHYEGGMRVPFITAWAKTNPKNPLQKNTPIAQGVITQQMGTVYDLVPTILNVTQTKNPAIELDGINLKKHFTNKSKKVERDFLMHFPHSHRSSYFTVYKKGDWKIIYHYHHKKKDPWSPIELYNLAEDRDESNNLATKHPEKLKVMFDAMQLSLKQTQAQYPLNLDKSGPLKPSL